MFDISVSQLVNEIDKTHFTLYAEWQSTHFKIILLRSCMIPLSGEMHIENANYFLDHLSESFDTYLRKTRYAFSGENAEMQFFLQNDLFTWKQQNILTRGEITVYPISNILIISDILKQSLEHYQECRGQVLTLKKENEYLNKTNLKLITDIEEMINIKNTMEKDLYSKFLVLLNSKKKKIRELQEVLDNKKHVTESKYDETTEESGKESDTEDEKIHDASGKSINTKKRKINYKDGQTIIPTVSKKVFEKRKDSSDESPIASTSKDELILHNTDIHPIIKSKSLLNATEEESEEDLFSQE